MRLLPHDLNERLNEQRTAQLHRPRQPVACHIRWGDQKLDSGDGQADKRSGPQATTQSNRRRTVPASATRSSRLPSRATSAPLTYSAAGAGR